MKSDEKERMIKRIIFYSESVNGFPITEQNKLYWNLLPDDILTRVYKKWQELYATGTFFREESK